MAITHEAVDKIPDEHATQIDPALLAFHRETMATLHAAQAVARAWLGYLARRYQLTPADVLDDAGCIHRISRTAE